MRALVLVDLQYDFMPGGALAVPRGDEVVPVANRLVERFELVVATQDWHPAEHGSFASRYPGKKPGDRIDLNGLDQILWPDHCVQGSHGAALHKGLKLDKVGRIIQKGTNPGVDSYSAFFDNARRKSTGLADFLRDRGVRQVYLMGLATDYCVLYSAIDAVELGFETYLVLDGCRGIDLQRGDVDQALGRMSQAGVRLVQSDAV